MRLASRLIRTPQKRDPNVENHFTDGVPSREAISLVDASMAPGFRHGLGFRV